MKLDSGGISTLHWAALNGRQQVCRYLLDHGVPVDIRGGDQEAPAIHWAICKGHVGVVSLLLQYGADWRLSDVQGYNSVHVAAQNGQEMILILLEAHGADLNSTDKAGRSALLWAAYRGHTGAVESLIRSSSSSSSTSSLNYQDESGKSPLHWAVIKGQAACAAKLAKAGAAFDLRDIEGKLPADWAKAKQISWFDRLNQITTDYRKSRYKTTGKGLEILGTCVAPCLITPVLLLTFTWIPTWWWSLLAGGLIVFLLYTFVVHFCIPFDQSIQESAFLSYYNYSTLSILIVATLGYLIPQQFTTRPVLSLICAAFAGSTGWSLFNLKSANPGKLALPRDTFEKTETIRRLGSAGILDKRRFCVTCCIQKPLRSKHCKTCDRCVSKFDHHCPWINNCVGFHNHRAFMTYLYSCIGFSFTFLPLAWSLINSLPIPVIENRSPSCFLLSDQICFAASAVPSFFWLAGFGAFMTFWLLMLTVTQTYQILRNFTTNEMSNYTRLEYFYPQLFPEDVPFEVIKDSDKSRRFVNVFDRGLFSNYSDFWKSPLKQQYDYDSIKEFKEEDLRRVRSRKQKQQQNQKIKSKGSLLAFFKKHKLSGSDTSITNIINILSSPKITTNKDYKQCKQSCCSNEEEKAESPRLQSNSSKEPLLEGQNMV